MNSNTEYIASSSDKNDSLRKKVFVAGAIAIMLLLLSLLLVFDCDYCFSSKTLLNTANADPTALVRSGAEAIVVVAVPVRTSSEGEIVVVTGATGRLGSKLYFELRLKQQQMIQMNDGSTNDDTTSNNIISEVRAVVRNRTKARTVLGCTRCDETEGIYLGDITDPNGLESVMRDGKVTALAIAAGSSPYSSKDVQRAVEFDGVVNSVRALAMKNVNNGNKAPKVVLCSSMGTAGPLGPHSMGNILHWKLNAEAFLSTVGLPSFIVKPCGLKDDIGTNHTLYTGNFDTPSKYYTITRDNVAHIMAEAVIMPTTHHHYRFDLCSKPGNPTNDFKKVIEDSRWEWEKK